MEIYLVGGAVRDTLLGIEVKEKDWVVVGSSQAQMIELGYKQVGSDFPVFLHPDSKEEYALARTERKSGLGHKGFSFNTKSNVTLEEDLKRRDLTINAIAQTVDGTFIDPFGGQKDIRNKVLRKVSRAFEEDPLRVLRVARFAAKLKYLDFSIDKNTLGDMKKLSLSGELDTLPKERVWQETFKSLKEKNPEIYFETLIESESFSSIEDIKNIDLAFFKKVCSKIDEPQMRWASLVLNTKYNLEVMNEIFGAPKKIRELARILGELAKFCRSQRNEVKAHEILAIIEKVDGIRRNKRFRKVLKILKAGEIFLAVGRDTFPWGSITKKLMTVKVSSNELKDKEIRKDLKLQRLKIIEDQLNKNG